jgi:hypothetical protein
MLKTKITKIIKRTDRKRKKPMYHVMLVSFYIILTPKMNGSSANKHMRKELKNGIE